MMDKKRKPPVIIIGMHRSGTTMIAQLLEKLGLFMGKTTSKTHESIFFKKLNIWILNQSGGSWDNPEPINYLLNNKELCALAIDFISFYIKTPRLVSYLGWPRYLRNHSLQNIEIPWGWKDPRNIFTLPIWLELFPDAKVIHVYRHGVDVAASLLRREKQFRESKLKKLWLHNIISTVSLHKSKIILSARCNTLEDAFNLWEQYMNEARKQIASISNQAIEIRYESFLSDTISYIKNLVEFCELQVSGSQIKKVAAFVTPTRAFAFQSNAELMSFNDTVRLRLSKFDY